MTADEPIPRRGARPAGARLAGLDRRRLRGRDRALDEALLDVPEPGERPDVDLRAYFDRRAPVELEIGCGKGSFLVVAAERFPGVDFVGIELARPFARVAAARVLRRRLVNARVMCGDASRLVQEVLAPASLAAVHVYYPDPWPKKRHAKRRLLGPSFFDAIERVLEPLGLFCLATDHATYFEHAMGCLSCDGRFEPLTAFEWLGEGGVTNFERKYLREGRTSYRASFRKRSPEHEALDL